MNNPLEYNQDVIQNVLLFLGNRAYLFVASVSTQWRLAWGQQPTLTGRRWAVQSCPCLDWARACGLGIWDNPCLHAAAAGRLDVLQRAVALGYSREGMPICEHAASGGHLEVMKWCRLHGYPWCFSGVRAAEGGHLDILRWCKATGCPWDMRRNDPAGRSEFREKNPFVGDDEFEHHARSKIMAAAAGRGHLEVVVWCREQGYPWPQEACYLAAKGGHFEVLKWLRANDCPWSSNTMEGAVERGHLEMLVWCKADGCPWTKSTCDTALRHGMLDIVKWCIVNDPSGYPPFVKCSSAAANGRLEVIQWLRESGYPWGREVCFSAACGGHFEVLKWCVANGCLWDEALWPVEDGFKGSVSMMEWAVANGCRWMRVDRDFDTFCAQAAKGGNLEVLQWCETHGVLDSSLVAVVAASRGHVHILEWMWENGSLSKEHVSQRLQEMGFYRDRFSDGAFPAVAAIGGWMEVVEWFTAHGYGTDERTCAGAAKSGNLQLLQWCRDNGCPWDEWTCEHAAKNGNLEMLAWCRRNGCPWNFRRIFNCAVDNRHFEVVRWCYSQTEGGVM